MEYIKSPLNYMGGKYKILDKIIPTFPTGYSSFVDLFAGGLNVGINVVADKIYVNDQINYLIDMYSYFIETPTDIILDQIDCKINNYDLTKTNKEGYLKFRSDYNQNGDILDLFILSCFAFNHQIRFNGKHEFNTPFGNNRSSYNDSIKNNLIAFCDALKKKNLILSSKDFTEFDFSVLEKGDLIYCDPPYLISTGSYNDGKRGFKDWSEKEEIQLLELLSTLDREGINFALSNVLVHKGLQNSILVDWSKKYNIHYIDKNYSNCNYHIKDKGTQTVEVLITNY